MANFKRAASRAASVLGGSLLLIATVVFWFSVGCLGLALIAHVNPGLDWGFWDIVRMAAGVELVGILLGKPGGSS